MGQAPSKSVHPPLINYTTCHFNRASGMIEYTNARIDMRGISRQSVRESCFSAGLPIETAESVACVLSRALDTKSDQQIVSKAIIHKIQQYTLSTHGISGHLIQNLWAILKCDSFDEGVSIADAALIGILSLVRTRQDKDKELAQMASRLHQLNV